MSREPVPIGHTVEKEKIKSFQDFVQHAKPKKKEAWTQQSLLTVCFCRSGLAPRGYPASVPCRSHPG